MCYVLTTETCLWRLILQVSESLIELEFEIRNFEILLENRFFHHASKTHPFGTLERWQQPPIGKIKTTTHNEIFFQPHNRTTTKMTPTNPLSYRRSIFVLFQLPIQLFLYFRSVDCVEVD